MAYVKTIRIINSHILRAHIHEMSGEQLTELLAF